MTKINTDEIKENFWAITKTLVWAIIIGLAIGMMARAAWIVYSWGVIP